MGIESLREGLKPYAQDIKLNLFSVLSEEGAPGLSTQKIWAVALACAYATKDKRLSSAVLEDASISLSPEFIEAAKAATTIMGMNNVYYRFTHLVEDKEFTKLPARLRMNIIGKPGIAKVDFELMCLAVSAMAGCGLCVNSHIHEVKKAGLSNEGVHSSIRIAATIQAAAQALSIG